MSTTLKQPLTNVQLELLKAFSHNLKESELIELKKAIALFFAEKLIKKADETWVNNECNQDKLDAILNTKRDKKS